MAEFDPYFELGEMPTPDEDKSPYHQIYDEMDNETADNWPPYSMSPEAEEMLAEMAMRDLSQGLAAIDQQAAELAKRREQILRIFHEVAEELKAHPLE